MFNFWLLGKRYVVFSLIFSKTLILIGKGNVVAHALAMKVRFTFISLDGICYSKHY